MKLKNITIGLVLLSGSAIFALTGCLGNSSSTPAAGYNGKLIDSPVEGVSYVCGTKSGTTAADGSFGVCPAGSTVTFSIGELTLGDSAATGDNIFFITDIVGVARDATDNEEVLKIAVLLQSLDRDGDPTNGIDVPAEAAEEVPDGTITDLTTQEVEAAASDVVVALVATYTEMATVDATEAEANLADSLSDIEDGTITPPPAPTGSEGGS